MPAFLGNGPGGAKRLVCGGPDAATGSRFYEEYIGMERKYSTAELVLSDIELPVECGAPPCWLSVKDLQALGLTILNSESGFSTVRL